MEPTPLIRGTALPLPHADVDTDQLLPKQFLTRLERSGFGRYLLHDRRGEPGFPLDDPRYAGASILLAGRNFGCGSSREQAAWAIHDGGFAAVVAPGYGGLFQSNCIRSGVLAVTLPTTTWEALVRVVTQDPATIVRIDVAEAVLEVPARGWRAPLEISPAARRVFCEGVDAIDQMLGHDAAITRHESRRAGWLPRTTGGEQEARPSAGQGVVAHEDGEVT